MSKQDYILTEHERIRAEDPGKTTHLLNELFPEFCEACLRTKDKTEWAHLEAYSNYTLAKIRNLRKNNTPKSRLFFHARLPTRCCFIAYY